MALRFNSQHASYKRSHTLGVFVLVAVLIALSGFLYFKNTPEAASPINSQQEVKAMDRALPTRLIIEKLGIDAPIVDLGLDDKGALEVPKKGGDAGWYVSSPTPGQIGPSVIAGHYDWVDGPALFFKLKNLEIGDEIRVNREDGSTAIFKVERTQQYEQDNFPTIEVYGPTSEPVLRLITCAGSYSQKAGRYSDNYVVYAKLVQD